MKHTILIIITSLLFISCSQTVVVKTSGGLGKDINEIYYTYKPQSLQISNMYSDISFDIKTRKFDDQSPIEADLKYIINCIEIEIEDNQGILVNSKDMFSDILIDIILSKYITRKYDRKYYKTFIDLDYTIFDNIYSKKIISKQISISGNGHSSSIANQVAIQKVIKNILLDDELQIFLRNIHNSNDNKISHFLNRLSKNLLIDFEKTTPINKENNIAFVGFENDTNLLFSNGFSTSLMNFWKKPQYKFFSRDQLEKIMDEYKLLSFGVLKETSFLENLELQSVEFIIVGNIANVYQQYILEVQIIDIKNGEIVTSKSSSIVL